MSLFLMEDLPWTSAGHIDMWHWIMLSLNEQMMMVLVVEAVTRISYL